MILNVFSINLLMIALLLLSVYGLSLIKCWIKHSRLDFFPAYLWFSSTFWSVAYYDFDPLKVFRNDKIKLNLFMILDVFMRFRDTEKILLFICKLKIRINNIAFNGMHLILSSIIKFWNLWHLLNFPQYILFQNTIRMLIQTRGDYNWLTWNMRVCLHCRQLKNSCKAYLL